MKRFEDYKHEVIQAYKEKKAKGALPHNLQYPTTAKLKSECLNVFHRRYSEKDSETFKMLFNERDNANDYYKAIETTNSDSFKALNNLLNNEIKKPGDKYIELLAWLIDFQPRPHQPITGYEFTHNEKPPAEEEEPVSQPETQIPTTEPLDGKTTINAPEDDNSTSTPPVDEEDGFPPKNYKTMLLCFLAFVVLSGSYFIYEICKPNCMYWDGDQYQYISCDERQDYGTIIIPLDPVKFAHLKRIKNRSQIRRSDIGKVHYSKINNEVEFYTVESENPTDTAKRLLPMSDHIFKKYVLNQ